VVIPVGAGLPTALVPNKPGSTDKASGRLEAVIKVGPLGPVTALAFSPDGKYLLVGTYGRVALWDLSTGTVARHLESVEGAVHQITYSKDGKRLAVAGGLPTVVGRVLLYDGADPKQPVAKLEGHTDVVQGFSWSPDGTRIATASPDRKVQIWDATAAKSLVTIKDHTDAVYSVSFSTNGRQIASTGKDKSIKLFDSETGRLQANLTGHNQEVYAVAYTPDGRALISTGQEPSLRWWQTALGTNFRTTGGHGAEVYEIQFSKDGKRIITVSADQTVRLFNSGNGNQEKALSSNGEVLLSAAESPDGKLLAAGSWNGIVRLWEEAKDRLLVFGFEVPDANSQDLVLATPEGYVSVPAKMQPALGWRFGGVSIASEPLNAALLKPEEILKALKSEPLSPVKIEAPK
jgi:WD40 repeat protein